MVYELASLALQLLDESSSSWALETDGGLDVNWLVTLWGGRSLPLDQDLLVPCLDATWSGPWKVWPLVASLLGSEWESWKVWTLLVAWMEKRLLAS